MTNNEDIKKEADYYLENDVNITQASKKFGISKRTFQLHMKKLEEIDPLKFILVKEKKQGNIKLGTKKGGTIGHKSLSWSELDISEITSYLIENELTYRQAAEELGIPKSTLYELIKTNKDEKITSLLFALSQANKRNIPVSEVLNENKKNKL